MTFRRAASVAGLAVALVAVTAGPAAFVAPPSLTQNASPVAGSPVAATPVTALPAVVLPTLADLGIALPAGVEVVPLAAAPIDVAGWSASPCPRPANCRSAPRPVPNCSSANSAR